jgi:hypothetical protein
MGTLTAAHGQKNQAGIRFFQRSRRKGIEARSKGHSGDDDVGVGKMVAAGIEVDGNRLREMAQKKSGLAGDGIAFMEHDRNPTTPGSDNGADGRITAHGQQAIGAFLSEQKKAAQDGSGHLDESD